METASWMKMADILGEDSYNFVLLLEPSLSVQLQKEADLCL